MDVMTRVPAIRQVAMKTSMYTEEQREQGMNGK